MLRKHLLVLSALLATHFGVLPARAEAIHVAVAANFAEPMKRIKAQFEKGSQHTVLTSVGATGTFYAQIKSGAPFQVLLSADDETPVRLEKEGHAVAGSRFTYAIGKLALWSAREGVVDARGEVLRRGGFEHIALANPRLAPYGTAAVETMKALGVYDPLSRKIVQGENIAQTFQFISTGNTLLGFIALSQITSEDGKRKPGSVWIVPETLYAPIRQDAVLLDKGRSSAASRALLTYLKSPEAQRIILAYGYALDK